MADMKAVYIEWDDSGYRTGWQDAVSFEPCKIKTLGWLVSEDANCVVVSACEDGQGCVNCPMSIPRKAITLFQEVQWPTS